MAPPVTEARVFHRPSRAHGYLPEGPRALRDGRLAWITIQNGRDARSGALHVLDVRSRENRTFELPGRPGFVYETDREEVLLLGMERAIGLYDLRVRRFEPCVEGIDAHTTGTIVNDAVLGPGWLIFGTKDTAFRERKAGLWLLRLRDRRLFALRTDQLCSNGKVVRDLGGGRLELFDIDSPTRVVARYEVDVARGTASEPVIAVDLRHERAVPDGMIAVPGTDDVVIAMFDPGPATSGRALRCSLRDGTVVREYRTPGAAQVTCPQWLPVAGGVDLVLTTAAEGMDAQRLAEQPDAGCLFAVRTAVATAPMESVAAVAAFE